MENENDDGLLPAFELGGEQDGLHGDGGDDEKIVARDWRVRGPEEMGAENEREHQAAEQARPGLLQTEEQELISPAVPLRPRRPGPRPQIEGFDLGFDAVFEAHKPRLAALARRGRAI
jgi:hypothetical protein